MRTFSERLVFARRAAGYERAIDAIKRLRLGRNYYQYENGLRAPSPKVLVFLAQHFKVSAEWLLTGKGAAPTKKGGVPLIGNVGAGAAVYPLESTVFEHIEPPPGCPDGAFALRVVGDSMYPVYEDGFILICIPVINITDIVNRRAVVDLEDGRRLVKRVTNGSRSGLFTLSSHNQSDIRDVRIAAAARIRWIEEP
jgi:SOS-response transcriptional repressor LexA